MSHSSDIDLSGDEWGIAGASKIKSNQKDELTESMEEQIEVEK